MNRPKSAHLQNAVSEICIVENDKPKERIL